MAVKRLMALDVLRGLTIALMIMVNTPGSWQYVYPPLRHAKWHGCTPTDLVFPFFLFIVGVSMWYSFKKYGGGLTKEGFRKVLKRFSVIFLLGVFLNLFPKFDFENLRILGVLQRIAIAYGIAAILCMSFNVKQLVGWFIALLLGYWGLLSLSGSEDVFGLSTNIVRDLDLAIFGENHIYKGFGIPFDPEGLLSSIPSVGTVLLGYFSGRIIEHSRGTIAAIKNFIVYGVVGVAIGLIWDLVFPINKPLWTSSYVVYTGGLAMLFLSLLLWIIDVKGFKKWSQPFIHFGMNPLFIYLFAGIWADLIYVVKIGGTSAHGYLYTNVFVPIAGNMNGSLLFAIAHITFFWLLTYILYRRNIFIKL